MGIHNTVQEKMAKGAGKGGEKELACGSKPCYLGLIVVGVILLIVGIVLVAMVASVFGSKKDNADSGCAFWHGIDSNNNICDNCYDDDNGKKLLEQCCTKAVDCGDVAASWGAGIALIVIGIILTLIATCGVCMCCCFGKGAPPVALTGAPPVAET